MIATSISNSITRRYGLEVDVSTFIEEAGLKILIAPKDVQRAWSFEIELSVGWRSIEAKFRPGSYATEVVKAMRLASPSQKSVFVIFARSLLEKKAAITLKFDDMNASPATTQDWPNDWRHITLFMSKVGVLVEKNSGYDYLVIEPWILSFFGLVFSLLPVEEKILEVESSGEMTVLDSAGHYEGTESSRQIKVYERSRMNRAACIEIHGTNCKICGFSFGETYGELGDGFIHVHHIIPLSELGSSYRFDPSRDLIPVCPNCHSMLHRKRPALTPEELSNILKLKRENTKSRQND